MNHVTMGNKARQLNRGGYFGIECVRHVALNLGNLNDRKEG